MNPFSSRKYSEKNFTIKPVSGGKPPKDNIINVVNTILIGDSWATILRCPRVYKERKSDSKNIEVFITKYIISMAIAAFSEYAEVVTIQPIFPIEEKARIFRTCVWFSPPHPPTITDSKPMAIIRLGLISCSNENRRTRGAIFCQVAIINPWAKGSPCKTSGNQKWQGAKPSLNAKAIVIDKEEVYFMGARIDHEPVSHAWINPLFKRSAALSAWIRKYFIVASTLRGENLEHKIGTKAKVLTSSPTQIINHFSEEMTMIVPEITVRIRDVETIRYIELEGNLTLNNLIIS